VSRLHALPGPVRPAGAAGEGAVAAEARPWRGSRWIEGFVLFQLVCQLSLLSAGVGGVRVVVRMAAFGASLLLLAALRGRGGRAHPAAGPALLAMAVVVAGIANPGTPGLLAGAAQAGLYVAVLAPLFWVPRLRVDTRMLRRTLMILWAFHALSAGLGVLQVWRPGTFQPNLSTVVASKGKGYVESLKITTAGGERVFRPMGLTDIPGGASISGMYAVLLGIGIFLTRRRPLALGAAVGSMALGMMCLYLAQVRSVVVMTGIAVVALVGVLAWRREVGRLGALAATLAVVVMAAFVTARGLAGPAVTNRLGTLVQDRPSRVYYANRGMFLEDTFIRILPEYPLGAGLGRWGMIASYFGSPPPAGSGPAESIWVEIQWTGWAVDGGLPLIVAYLAALGATLLATWRIARARRMGELPFWGAVVLGYSVGAVALTFSYPLFLGQAGMEFWLLNATLFAAAREARRTALSAPGDPVAEAP
jgi:hypothetical protein